MGGLIGQSRWECRLGLRAVCCVEGGGNYESYDVTDVG